MFPTYEPIGDRTIWNTTTSSFVVQVPQNCNGLLVWAITADMRIRIDEGVGLATSDDMPLVAGQPPLLIMLAPGSSIRAIQAAANAKLGSQPVRYYPSVAP